MLYEPSLAVTAPFEKLPISLVITTVMPGTAMSPVSRTPSWFASQKIEPVTIAARETTGIEMAREVVASRRYSFFIRVHFRINVNDATGGLFRSRQRLQAPP